MTAYKNPEWNNNSEPAINADNLNAISDALEVAECPYGVCTTASNVSQKEVTIPFTNEIGSLFAGFAIRVKFVATNVSLVQNPTLNVNETGDIPMRYSNDLVFNKWKPNQTVSFVYDGSYWRVMGSGVDSFGREETLTTATATSVQSVTGQSASTPDAAFSAITSFIAGRAKIATGSYTGDGNATKTLTISFSPRLVAVSDATGNYSFIGFLNSSVSRTTSNLLSSFSISGKTATWTSNSAGSSLNMSGQTYNYLVIGV